MTVFRPLLVALLVLPLAGCLDGPDLPSQEEYVRRVNSERAGGTGNDTDMAANASLPTLGPAVDPWLPGETERLLVEGTVQSQPPACTNYYPDFGQVWAGCGNLFMPDGVLVPEGTLAVRVEGDASGAQRHGTWGAFVMSTRTRGWAHGDREWAMGEPTTQPTGSWRWVLEPSDWDSPTQPASSFFFHFMGHGETANGLVGPVRGRVFAERDLNWTPTAPLDHFRIPALHAMPQAGVITLLDANVSLAQPGTAATVATARVEAWHPAQDKLPLGTTQLVVAAAWGAIEGCTSGFACSVRIDAATPTASYGGYSGHPPVEVGPGHVLYVFAVPDEFAPEPDFLEASLLAFFPYVFNQCPATVDQIVPDCKRNFTDVKADARLIVEAWEGDADLAAVKARLRVA